MRDELIQINVTFTQAGTSGQPASAIGIMQIWHPVGVMVAEWSVNMTLSEPNHSELNLLDSNRCSELSR